MGALKWGLCVLVLAAVIGAAPPEKVEPAPEVKWARGLADDFWRALLNGKEEQASALLSPELAKSLVTYEWAGFGEKSRLIEWPAHKWLALNLPDGPDVAVTFNATELSPDRTEVVFRGRLSGKDPRDKPVAADFTVRVAKESAAGKWSIRYLLVTNRKGPAGKGK